jgi:putative tricarboxylic transport membrane protein
MAMLLGALTIYGMQPGPMLIKEHPDLFWGVVTTRPISLGVFLLVLALLVLPMLPRVKKKREVIAEIAE